MTLNGTSLPLVKQNGKWQLLKAGVFAPSIIFSKCCQTPAFPFLNPPAVVQHVHLGI